MVLGNTLLKVDSDGAIYQNVYYITNGCAMRPIVCLKSNIGLERKSNGTYKIVEKTESTGSSESVGINKDATRYIWRKASEEESAIIIKQAEKKAEKIIKEARQTSELEHDKMIKEAQNEIAEMVVSVTEKIVLQAGTAESFDQFLNTVERSGANE